MIFLRSEHPRAEGENRGSEPPGGWDQLQVRPPSPSEARSPVTSVNGRPIPNATPLVRRFPISRKTTKTRKPAAKKNGHGKVHGRIIRVVSVVNRQTKKSVLLRVTRDGHITDPRIAKRLKITSALRSWREIEADTWKSATAAFRAGKGTPVTAK